MVLTRYLYDKAKVLTSFSEAVLKHYYDESIFWAYELYFSGFDEEVFAVLDKIYTTKFSRNHPKLGLYIQKKMVELNDKPELVATIIKNLTMKNDSICEAPNVKFVNVKPHHIIPFLTKELDGPSWLKLHQVCLYGVLGKATLEELDEFRKNWIILASGSPIWAERIIHGKGRIEQDTIVFDDEEDEEEWFEKYGYEPDEQPLEIQQRCIGVCR